jgi:hypothetical protein
MKSSDDRGLTKKHYIDYSTQQQSYYSFYFENIDTQPSTLSAPQNNAGTQG